MSNDPSPGHSAPALFRRLPGGTRRRTFAVILIFLLLISLVGGYAWLQKNRGYSSLNLMGSPVYVADVHSGQTFLLTGQWRTMRTPSSRTSNNYKVYTDLYIDLWSINAHDATPRWRKRLDTGHEGPMDGRDLLGVDSSTVWLYLRGAVVALAAADGRLVLPAGQLEALNPPLRGLMPTDRTFLHFDSRGLIVTSLDGRHWQIDPDTFIARTLDESTPAKPGACVPAFGRLDGTALHRVRGLDIPGHWLGLLTNNEAVALEKDNVLPELTRSTWHRLWGAKTRTGTNFFGEFLDYTDLAPLTESPKFLDGGLLRRYESGKNLPAIWLRDPDSVLVLHRKQLGESAPLHLSRIAGPEGTTVWSAALPLTALQSVLRAEETILLSGLERIGEDPTGRDPAHTALQRLVAVTLKTGDLHVFDFAALDSHPAAAIVDPGL